MDIVCLDMEGVLVPEIWIAFSEESGIPELRRTTRDEPDYNKLMNYRLAILKEHGLGLGEIQSVISRIDPLPGAKAFLNDLRERAQTVTVRAPAHEEAGNAVDLLQYSGGRPGRHDHRVPHAHRKQQALHRARIPVDRIRYDRRGRQLQ